MIDPPVPGADVTPRYRAFISYSHTDARWARRLSRALEGYRLPATLVGTSSRAGRTLERGLGKVFRDRDELRASSSLTDSLRGALARSDHLIVICSPASATSSYVQEEIVGFARGGRRECIHALIVAGEPHASREPARSGEECLPPALRFEVDASGAVTDRLVEEPLAADARKGRDGARRAILKVIASLIDVDFDLLYRRDRRRRRQQQGALGALGVGVLAVVGVLGWQAWTGNREAAERGRRNRHDAYVAALNLAEQAHRDRDPARVLERLAEQQPADGQEDVREFAWHRLWRLYHGERTTLLLNASVDENTHVAVSADGATVAAAFDGTVRLYDATTGQELHQLEAHGGEDVTGLAFALDGNTLVTAGESTVRLWDARAGRALRVLRQDHPAGALFLSADGTRAATAAFEAPFVVWDLARGQSAVVESLGTRGSASAVLLPDDGAVAIAYERSLVFHDTATGELLSEHRSDRQWRLAAAALSPDGRTIALAFDGGASEVRLFDRETAREGRALTVAGTEGNSVLDVAFSADGGTVVLATGDPGWSPRQVSRVVGWDVASGRPRFALGEDETGFANLMAFAPDGRTFATASADYGIRLWDAASGVLRNLLGHHGDRVWQVAFSGDGGTLATMSADGTVRVWNARPAPDVLPIPYRGPEITAVAFSRDGARIATGDANGVLAIHAAGEVAPVATVEAHTDGIAHIAFSPDGRLLASSARDGSVTLRDAATLAERASLRGQAGYGSALHFGGVSLVHFARQGGVIANGPGLVHGWTMASGRVGAGWTQPANVLAVSADGRRSVTIGGFEDGSGHCDVRVRGVGAGASRLLTRCGGSAPTLTLAALSDDGRYLAVGGPDLGVPRPDDASRAMSGVLLYDLEAGRAPVVLELDVRFTTDAALAGLVFSPDGRTLATASLAADSVRQDAGGIAFTFWSVPDGARLETLVERHDAVCNGSGGTSCARELRFSRDGSALLFLRGVRLPQLGATEIVRYDRASGERRAHTVPGRIDRLELAGGGTTFATITVGGDAPVLWDAVGLRPTGHVGERRAHVESLAFRDDTTVLAATIQADDIIEPAVKLWNMMTGEEVGSPGDATSASSVALSADGRVVAVQSQDRLLIRELEGWRQLAAFEATSRVDPLGHRTGRPALTRDGRLVATMTGDSVMLWDVVAGSARRLTGEVFAAFSADGRNGATIGECSVLHVVDTATGRERATIDLDRCIDVAVFSPDGGTILTATRGGADYADARLWRVDSGQLLARLDGYVADNAVVAFSPDGRTLAAAGVDGAIDLWNPENGRRLFTLRAGQPITALAFSPAGSTLAAVSGDHVRLWRTRPPSP
jgi:WD40 repeat protein